MSITLALGVRGAMKSEAAIKAATTNATVVKKPKTFCARTRVECIFGERVYFQLDTTSVVLIGIVYSRSRNLLVVGVLFVVQLF